MLRDSTEQTTAAKDERQGASGRLLAAAGALGAALASSCCIVPLVLVILGVSGAWIGALTALEPYKPYVLTGTALLLSGGFWQVYAKPQDACEANGYCGRPAAGRITKTILWLGMALALTAATVNFWAPLLY